MATNLNLECGALEFQTLLLNRDNDPRKLDSPSAGWSRPSNPIVKERLRPSEVGFRCLRWLVTTLESYCKKEITASRGWIPTLAMARYDPQILL